MIILGSIIGLFGLASVIGFYFSLKKTINILRTHFPETLKDISTKKSISTHNQLKISPIKFINFLYYGKHENLGDEEFSNFCRITVFLFAMAVICILPPLLYMNKHAF